MDGKEHIITHRTDEHGNKETQENIVELDTGTVFRFNVLKTFSCLKLYLQYIFINLPDTIVVWDSLSGAGCINS